MSWSMKRTGQGLRYRVDQICRARALEEGCKLIELDTDLGHDKAEKLYEKNGYSKSGSYYHKDIDPYADE